MGGSAVLDTASNSAAIRTPAASGSSAAPSAVGLDEDKGWGRTGNRSR
jgi:hypothetical protein